MQKSARHAQDVQVTSVRLVAKSAVILVVRFFVRSSTNLCRSNCLDAFR